MAIPEFRYQGQAFRAHDPGWAWTPESGEGARLHGGRFNEKGVPALYLSLRYETAWAEAQQSFPFKPQPLTLCAYDLDCSRIVDLRDRATCDAAGISPDDLGCAWESLLARSITPPTHQLAKRLMSRRVAGILVPSFAPGAPTSAANLVLWSWTRNRPNQVRCIDDLNRLARIKPSI